MNEQQQQQQPPAIPVAVTEAVARGDAFLVDLRDASAFSAVRVRGSSSVPWSSFLPLRGALPPPGARVAFVVAPGDEQAARAEIDGWVSGKYDVLGTWRLPRRADRAAAALGDAAVTGPSAPAGPGRRMWRESDAAARAVRLMGAPPAKGAAALDLGCGSGRDAVFFALAGFGRVVGADKRAVMLDNMTRIAEHHGVGARVEPVRIDLQARDAGGVADALAARAGDARGYALVMLCRYLHRPLIPAVRDRLVAPGGLVVVQHFLMGAARPARPEQKLGSGELLELFHGYEVLAYEEASLPEPDGRPAALLVARRPL